VRVPAAIPFGVENFVARGGGVGPAAEKVFLRGKVVAFRTCGPHPARNPSTIATSSPPLQQYNTAVRHGRRSFAQLGPLTDFYNGAKLKFTLYTYRGVPHPGLCRRTDA